MMVKKMVTMLIDDNEHDDDMMRTNTITITITITMFVDTQRWREDIS